MTADELYDHITKQITPERALRMLLRSTVDKTYALEKQYKEIVLEQGDCPLLIMVACGLLMDWHLAVEKGKDDDPVRGITMGTEEYLKSIFGH